MTTAPPALPGRARSGRFQGSHKFTRLLVGIADMRVVYYGTALSLAGLESALALGSLIGVLAIVPVAGVTTGFALSVGLAALRYETWTKVAVVCGIFIFGQTVEANILTPKLVGDRIHL